MALMLQAQAGEFVVSYEFELSRTYRDATETKRKMRSSRDLLEGRYGCYETIDLESRG
jgi:hypothetical protein